MNQPEAPTTVVDAIAAIPPQRVATDAVPTASPGTRVVAPASPRCSLGRLLLLPLGALCLYVGTTAGLAALDRLVTGSGDLPLLESPAVAVLTAVVALALLVTGARVVRGVLTR